MQMTLLCIREVLILYSRPLAHWCFHRCLGHEQCTLTLSNLKHLESKMTMPLEKWFHYMERKPAKPINSSEMAEKV